MVTIKIEAIRPFANGGIDLKKKKSQIIERQNRLGYLFIAPSMTVFAIFVFIPMLASLAFSFMDFNLMFTKMSFAGTKYYAKAIADPRFWNALKNSAIYTLAVLVLQIPFALLIAISIQRQCRRNDFFKTVYFIPAICSMSVISIIWSLLLNKDIGIVSYYLSFLGIHLVDWLNNPKWAMPAVVFISIWKNFGLTMIMLLAGLNNIPKHYYEAAEIDGASSWKKFWNITLPLLTPTLGFVTITTMIGSFQVFDQVYVMTKGGPLHKTETIVQYIYTMGIGSSKMAYACAMAMLLLVVLMFLTYICNRKLNQLERGLS